MSVKIELIFDTVVEARDFLNKGLTSAPMPAQVTQTVAPQPEDPIKALREAAASLIARMPAGEGPKKVRELLMAQGIAKFADANPQQATTLAAQMNAA